MAYFTGLNGAHRERQLDGRADNILGVQQGKQPPAFRPFSLCSSLNHLHFSPHGLDWEEAKPPHPALEILVSDTSSLL